MKVYLPKALDIDAHIANYPPTNIENFSKDRLIYILSLLLTIPATNKEIAEEREGWVPISSAILANRIKDYRSYLDYALGYEYPSDKTSALIETDNQYEVGVKSKAYRFTYAYMGEASSVELKPFEIREKTLNQSVKKETLKRKREVEARYPYLTKWFNKCLQIDGEAARQYAEKLRDEYQLKSRSSESQEKLISKEGQPKLDVKYISYLYNINRIEEGNFFLSVDDTANRFHSNLTNLKSELRNFLSYDGQQLVSIDIMNSQPFLSLALFNPKFYREAPPSAHINVAGNRSARRSARSFTIGNIAQEVYKHLTSSTIKHPVLEPQAKKAKTTTPIIDSLIMFSKNVQASGFQDLAQFEKLVVTGALYDEFRKDVKEKIGVDIGSRKKAKEAMFQVLFTDNRFYAQKEAEPKRLFNQVYPTAYNFYKLIKSKNSKMLPRLLQSIESWLILDVICSKLGRIHSHIPIFTIHDSIITTRKHEKVVKKMVEEEIKKHIGFRPPLKIEYLDPAIL